MKYPFIPKSTTYLEPGQIWPIFLSNGKCACGVVLAKLQRNGGIERRVFYAGLLGWSGDAPPDSLSIKDCLIIKKGALHIKAISTIGSEIVGRTDLQGLPGSPAKYTDDIVTMGYNVLNVVAEGRFVKHS